MTLDTNRESSDFHFPYNTVVALCVRRNTTCLLPEDLLKTRHSGSLEGVSEGPLRDCYCSSPRASSDKRGGDRRMLMLQDKTEVLSRSKGENGGWDVLKSFINSKQLCGCVHLLFSLYSSFFLSLFLPT